jgi:hypothetical protein
VQVSFPIRRSDPSIRETDGGERATMRGRFRELLAIKDIRPISVALYFFNIMVPDMNAFFPPTRPRSFICPPGRPLC